MKLCFPVEEDNGLNSNVFGHFGSAPLFVVYDTDGDLLSSIDNQDIDHIHGKCNPLKALNGKLVDAVIVGGIGAGAITKLNEMEIKVYKATSGSIQENLDLFKENKLTEMTMAHTCGGHIGGCIH
jgi:predicted Fe-Mo cluster-binding NifX family protein